MILLFLSILILLFDQISKIYILNNFELYQSVPIINDYLHITYIKNYGAAFGILQNRQMLFVIMTIIIMTFLTYYLFVSKVKSYFMRIALVFIISGGIGNLIDRVRLGYVVDFIDIKLSNIILVLKNDWPIFNIADTCIVVGSVMLCYYILFKYDKEVNKIGI